MSFAVCDECGVGDECHTHLPGNVMAGFDESLYAMSVDELAAGLVAHAGELAAADRWWDFSTMAVRAIGDRPALNSMRPRRADLTLGRELVTAHWLGLRLAQVMTDPDPNFNMTYPEIAVAVWQPFREDTQR